MNATSAFISFTRLVFLADASDDRSWSELYRMLPNLRKLLSCTVCGFLLKDPISPPDIHCSHHVCKKCKGGTKRLPSVCNWCKDYSAYAENTSLKIQMQSYKKLCEYILQTELYDKIMQKSQYGVGATVEALTNKRILDLLEEGAKFSDSYEVNSRLGRPSYSCLPNPLAKGVSTAAATASSNIYTSKDPTQIKTLSNGTKLYSVSYVGSGNKMTIKRKTAEELEGGEAVRDNTSLQTDSPLFKTPQDRSRSSVLTKKKGCRCGNASATPGKLTCCGQRCPCYVESKSCQECKCKGCRNPHQPSGFKVCPVINLNSFMPVAIAQGGGSSGSVNASGTVNTGGSVNTGYTSGTINTGGTVNTGGSSLHNISDLRHTVEELNFSPVNTGHVQVYTQEQLREAANMPPAPVAVALPLPLPLPRIVNLPLVARSIINIPSFQIPKM